MMRSASLRTQSQKTVASLNSGHGKWKRPSEARKRNAFVANIMIKLNAALAFLNDYSNATFANTLLYKTASRNMIIPFGSWYSNYSCSLNTLMFEGNEDIKYLYIHKIFNIHKIFMYVIICFCYFFMLYQYYGHFIKSIIL